MEKLIFVGNEMKDFNIKESVDINDKFKFCFVVYKDVLVFVLVLWLKEEKFVILIFKFLFKLKDVIIIIVFVLF